MEHNNIIKEKDISLLIKHYMVEELSKEEIKKLRRTARKFLEDKSKSDEEKVDILSKALADAEQETGANSDTTKKWQTELNNAQAELNKLVKNVDDNEKAMEQSADATKDNADAVEEVRKTVARAEQKIILNAARKQME